MPISLYEIRRKIENKIQLTAEEWNFMPEAWEQFAIKPDYLDGVTDKVKTVPLSQASPIKAKAKSMGRPMPVIYKKLIKVEWFRELDFMERVKIALGYNVVVMMGIATQHDAGQHQPLIMGLVTRQKSASDHMRNVVDTMLTEYNKDKAPVVSEPESKDGAK